MRFNIYCRACQAITECGPGGCQIKHEPTCPFHPDQPTQLGDSWSQANGNPIVIGVDEQPLEKAAREWDRDIRALLLEIPGEHIGDIRRQLKKSSTSVASNISEGLGRAGKSLKYKDQFFSYSLGSAQEAITQLKMLLPVRINSKERIESLIARAESIAVALERELGL